MVKFFPIATLLHFQIDTLTNCYIGALLHCQINQLLHFQIATLIQIVSIKNNTTFYNQLALHFLLLPNE